MSNRKQVDRKIKKSPIENLGAKLKRLTREHGHLRRYIEAKKTNEKN